MKKLRVTDFLDPRRTAGSIAIMCGFHLLLTYLDCRSAHLSEILVVRGDCLGKYFYIEFFSKLGFNVQISRTDFRCFKIKMDYTTHKLMLFFFNALSVFMNEKLWPLLKYH